MSGKRTTVRIVLADGGEFFVQEVPIPAKVLGKYDRLIDCLREDETVLKELYIDHARLVSAQIVTDED